MCIEGGSCTRGPARINRFCRVLLTYFLLKPANVFSCFFWRWRTAIRGRWGGWVLAVRDRALYVPGSGGSGIRCRLAKTIVQSLESIFDRSKSCIVRRRVRSNEGRGRRRGSSAERDPEDQTRDEAGGAEDNLAHRALTS